jgi:WD40 repeat protein
VDHRIEHPNFEFSSKSKHLSAGNYRGDVLVFDIENGQELWRLRGKNQTSNFTAEDLDFAITSDEDRVWNWSRHRNENLWNIKSGELVKSGNADSLPDAVLYDFSLDNMIIQSGGSAIVRSMDTGETLSVLYDYYGEDEIGIKYNELTRDHKWGWYSGGLYDASNEKLIKEIDAISVMFSPDNDHLLAKTSAGEYAVYKNTNGTLVGQISHNGDSNLDPKTDSITFNDAGDFAITTLPGEPAILWDISTGTLVNTFSDASIGLIKPKIYQTSQRVVFRDPIGKQATLFDLKTGGLVKSFRPQFTEGIDDDFSIDSLYYSFKNDRLFAISNKGPFSV